MGQATIFAGQKIKTLKSTLNLNGGADVVSSTTDPTSVAVDAQPGSLLLNTTSGKLYRKNDSGSSTNWSEVGSGGSGINYITNPSAATNTTGWSTYADAAGAQPVDGTGGSPNVTWTRSTTTPLRGAADFNFAKDAANRQGEGVATDFVIDLADQAKVLTVSFDYEVLSGTYADSDLTVYLIADPAGTPVVIQPAGYVVQAATVGTKMRQIATFQTQASGQSYRLCLHVASTSASDYTLAVDNVVVGPQVVQYGAPITDVVNYPGSPSFTNVTLGTGGTATFKYATVGDSIEIYAGFRLGTGGSCTGNITIPLPSGLSIDYTKLVATISAVGIAYGVDAGSNRPAGVVVSNNGGNSLVITGAQLGASGLVWNATVPFTWANTFELAIVAKVPIQGKSSTVQMSQDTDTRVVALRASKNSGSYAAGQTAVSGYNAATIDTHSSFNLTTGVYTAPVAGIYKITGQLSYAANATGFRAVIIRKNASNEFTVVSQNAGAGVYTSVIASGILSCVAGDTISLASDQNSGGALNANPSAETNNLLVERLSGPSAIAASETVRARVVMSANQAFGATVFYPNLNVKTYDSHNAMSAAGVFTAPISGVYSVKMSLASDGTTSFSTSQGLNYGIEKNGATVVSLLGLIYGNGTTNLSAVAGADSIYLNAGETIRMRCSSGVAFTAQASFNTFFAVERIGN